MAVFYQCAVNITSVDGSESIDVSSLYAQGMDLTVNQTNDGTRGINGLQQKGMVYKANLDQANSWVLRASMIPKDEYKMLHKWFENEVRLNISIVFKGGSLSGIKHRLTDWWLNIPPFQNTIDGTAGETTLTFNGFIYNIE